MDNAQQMDNEIEIDLKELFLETDSACPGTWSGDRIRGEPLSYGATI